LLRFVDRKCVSSVLVSTNGATKGRATLLTAKVRDGGLKAHIVLLPMSSTRAVAGRESLMEGISDADVLFDDVCQ
jgi:hypothetical protein